MTLEEVIVDDLSKVKASNILIYDMKERSPFYDKMILASVDSMRQATAVVSYIKEDVVKNGFNFRSVEGANTPWVLIDCYDILLSVFQKDERIHFDIDKVYMDYPKRIIEE
jgi:ribosome-associated protein